MSSQYPPLTCEEVKTILKNPGFQKRIGKQRVPHMNSGLKILVKNVIK